MSAYRLLFAGLLLLPLAIKARKAYPQYRSQVNARSILPPAICLGLHFATWIYGARLTLSAHATLLVNMTPVIMPYLLHLMFRERLTKGEWIGTAIAISGVFVLGGADFHLSPEYAWGDFVCVLSMLCVGAYLALARSNRNIPSIYLYVVPLYFVSGICCLIFALVAALFGALDNVIGPRVGHEVLMIAGLTVIPTVLGHSILNWGMKRYRGQTVVIINLSQFIFAAIIGYLFFEEVPHSRFYLASSLAIIGALIVIRSAPRSTFG